MVVMFISDAPTCLSGCLTLPLLHISMPCRVGASMPLLEKEFDLPTASIQIGYRQSRQCEVVGQEDQPLASLRIFETDSPQRRLEPFVRVKTREHDGLIADQPGAAIYRMRVATLGLQVRLATRDKEAARLVEAKQPFEIQEAAIHDVEGSRLGQQLI